MADVTWHEAAVETERSSEEIQQHIAAMEEEISETVDEIGHRVTGTLDWRAYVTQHPFVAVGAAAGLGLLASWMLSGPGEVRERGSGRTGEETASSSSGTGIFSSILPSLGSLAFMIAAGLAQKAVSEALLGAESGLETPPPGGPRQQPETAIKQTTENL